MANILVTAGQTLSQNVAESDLCSTMSDLVKAKNGAESTCADCGARLMRTEFESRPSIIASVPHEGKTCQVVELMRRRI